MVIKPPRLKIGDTLGVVAPAGPYKEELIFNKAVRSLEELGFKVVLGRNVSRKNGFLAGSDYDRALDINEFFSRDDIHGIICLRGGYGSIRILNLLDYNIIKNNPKIFIGYSDITAIHIAINKICNLVTFHGPMLYPDFGGKMDSYTKYSFLETVTNSVSYMEFKNPRRMGEIKILSSGNAMGKIAGGNLSLILSTLGTPYEIDTKDKILLIEEISEEPYKIDRMLTQLHLSGKLNDCSGIILGQFIKCSDKNKKLCTNLTDVFYDRLMSLGIPILYNVAFGHGKIKATIPLGVNGIITGDGKFVINEEAVK